MISLTPYFLIQSWLIEKHDAAFKKISGGKAHSVITGISRASKDISPAVIKESLNLTEEPRNLAFTYMVSPYGSQYLSFLEKRVHQDPDSTNLFILSVSPTTIMDIEADNSAERESLQNIYQLQTYGSKLNFEYMWRKSSIELIGKEIRTSLYGKAPLEFKIHENGWVEAHMEKGLQKSVNHTHKYRRSEEREMYLEKTIDMFNNIGTVCLVRLPVDKETICLESDVYPGFDELMRSLARKKSIHYLNYSVEGDRYEFYDKPGGHMVGESAVLFTKKLAIDIKGLYPHRWR